MSIEAFSLTIHYEFLAAPKDSNTIDERALANAVITKLRTFIRIAFYAPRRYSAITTDYNDILSAHYHLGSSYPP